jgi:hypothetical protein
MDVRRNGWYNMELTADFKDLKDAVRSGTDEIQAPELYNIGVLTILSG